MGIKSQSIVFVATIPTVSASVFVAAIRIAYSGADPGLKKWGTRKQRVENSEINDIHDL